MSGDLGTPFNRLKRDKYIFFSVLVANTSKTEERSLFRLNDTPSDQVRQSLA